MTQAEPALAFDAVSYRYPRGPEALRGVTLSVEPGGYLAIIGPNGGGKSTLLALAMGLLTPTQGTVRVFGRRPSAARREGFMASVPQTLGADLDFPVSVRQVIAMGCSWRTPFWRRVSGEARDRIERAMAFTGVTALAARPIGELSGGQRRRVMIARALAASPRILALDEPMAGIDEVGQRSFASMLERLRGELGLTVVVVTHDLRSIAAMGVGAGPGPARIACLRTTLHFHDAPEGVTPQVLAEVFEHDLSDVFGRVHVDAHAEADCDRLHGGAAP